MSTSSQPSVSAVVPAASQFIAGLSSFLEKGVGQWQEQRDAERRLRDSPSAAGAPGKKKQKADTKLDDISQIELEASIKSTAGPLVMAMMQTGGTFLEEQNTILHQRLGKAEQAIDDSNQRVSAAENKLAAHDTSVSKLTQDFEKLQIEHSNLSNAVAEQAELIAKLRGEVNVQRAWQPQTARQATASHANAHASAPQAAAGSAETQWKDLRFVFKPLASASGLPPSERREAECGNLGWDTPKDTLLVRFKEVMDKLNIDPSSFSDPHCLGAKGSSVLVTFKSVEDRRSAERRVRAANHSFAECSHRERPNVWLSPEKTSSEKISGRILAGLKKALDELEAQIDTPNDEEKWVIKGGTLFSEWKLVRGTVKHDIVTVTSSQIVWTKFADTRYSSLQSFELVSEWAWSRGRARS